MQYEGIRQEHVAVRTGAGVFDVSHMGEIETSGPGAEDFLQRILSNDVTKIAERGAQYSVLCREDGGVLDDLFTYRLGEDRFLTVTNASNHEKDLGWFREHAGEFDVEVDDAHERWAMLAVQGPDARAAVERHADGELPARMRTAEVTVAGRGLPRLRHGLHRRGRRGAHDPAGRRARRLGRAHRRRRRARPAWARATRCGSRSASTCTGTTCPRTATRSRPGSAGAASSTRTSSARRRCAASSPTRRWSRSPSPGPGSRGRTTPCTPSTATAS